MRQRFFFFQNPKQAVFFSVLILLALGCANIFSASFMKGSTGYLLRYVIFSLAGAAAGHIVRRLGYKKLSAFGTLGVGFILLMALLGAVFFWAPNNGAQRWIYLPGGISIQPSEFAKLFVIMLTARVLGGMVKQGKRVSLVDGTGCKVILLSLILGGFIYKEPDLGTAAIVVGLCLGIFLLSNLSKGQVFTLFGLSFLAIAVGSLATEYRRERLKVWLDPWWDAQDTGYQMVQSLLAIGSGGLTGLPWGQGTSKLAYLPEAHTDFAFAVFCQENGFLGALLLILVFVVLGVALARIAMRCKDYEGFLLVAGVDLLLVGQAAANMAMVCGLLPVIGVPLSFISYGGSSLVVSMLALGLALSVYDEGVKQELEEERQREESQLSPHQRRRDLRLVSDRWRR